MFTRTRRLAISVAMAAILVTSLAACGHTTASAPGGAPPSSPAPATAASPGTPATSPPRASAAGQLTGFFTAAVAADARLKYAAALVDSGIGSTAMSFPPATLAALDQLDTTAAARAIPGGMPAGLLRRVLLVYSDLESRTCAFNGILRQPHNAVPVNSEEGREILGCLRNGTPAATRFGADLAAAQSLARSTEPLAVAAPDSRAAAEVAIRVAAINGMNWGCDSCGGYVSTSLWPISWQPAYDPVSGRSDGTINGIRFRVDYQAGRGWQVVLWAC
jgi:hypothetical protein